MRTKFLTIVVLVGSLGSPGGAMEIPYFRMDSLAFMSSDIVLCDEVSYVKKTRMRLAWPAGAKEEYWEATLIVDKVLKGVCKPKEKLIVDVDLVYARRTADAWHLPAHGPDEERRTIPMGRALLFLTKANGIWQPVLGGVKLIVDGETYTYGQFVNNPGPLLLAKMAPENLTLLPITSFDEDLLLQDLQIAQEKAKKLTAPVRERASQDLIRTEYLSKEFEWTAAIVGIVIGLSLLFSLGVLCLQATRLRRARALLLKSLDNPEL